MIDWLIARAKRTPYHHLAGYMNRWWLVPYIDAGSAGSAGCVKMTWRRPVAKVLQMLGVAVRIHEILRSDTGRDPHDHPWPYVTIILKGKYRERRFENGTLVSARLHGPGSVLFRRATDLHQLELATSRMGVANWSWDNANYNPHDPINYEPVTTLFITGRYCQKWGFMTEAGKVPYNEYRKS